jgi:hypothetical protein
LVEEILRCVRKIFETVVELAKTWRFRIAEADQVRRDHMEATGQQRNQIPEHVRRTREAMQQDQCWSLVVTRLSVENLAAVYGGGAVVGHFFRLRWEQSAERRK